MAFHVSKIKSRIESWHLTFSLTLTGGAGLRSVFPCIIHGAHVLCIFDGKS